MTAENQALLDAIRVVVREEIAPLNTKIDLLTERVDVLTVRVDALTERVDALTERVDALTERVDRLELRMNAVEHRLVRVEEHVERLDLRTAQIAHDLFELQGRVDRGFRSLKDETFLALSELRHIKSAQQTDQKKIAELETKVADLQQRLVALETTYGGARQ
jgi:chromosome segregation ATPase